MTGSKISNYNKILAVIKRILSLALPYTFLIMLAFMPMWIYVVYNFSFAVFQQIIINLLGNKDVGELKQLIEIVLILSISAIAFLISGEFLRSHIHNLIVRDIKLSLFEKLNDIAMNKLNQLGTSEAFLRITNYSELIIRVITRDFYNILYNFLIYIVAFIYLARSNIYLALLAASTGPVMLFISNIFKKKQDLLMKQQNQSVSQIRSLSQQILAGMREIRIFNTRKIFLKIHNEVTQAQERYGFKLQMLQILQNQLSGVVKNGFNVIVLYFICTMAIENKISIGAVVAFNYLFSIMHGPVMGIANSAISARFGIICSEKVFEFNDIPGESDFKPKIEKGYPITLPQDNRYAININKASLCLGHNKENLFEEITLRITEGEKVALVGPSGGGKTSLLKLLCALYMPDGGDVELFGTSIMNNLEKARNLISYIPQNPFVFPGTVNMNISIGKRGADREEIVSAAKAAYAHEFIVKMGNGYDTLLRESATNISVGQKQRITIARALLKDAPILIADEPTAFLDRDAEEAFYKAINTNYKNRTVVVVAHKLSTVMHFDRILVVDMGKIVEEGTHSELINKKGIYEKLFTLQNSTHSLQNLKCTQ